MMIWTALVRALRMVSPVLAVLLIAGCLNDPAAEKGPDMMSNRKTLDASAQKGLKDVPFFSMGPDGRLVYTPPIKNEKGTIDLSFSGYKASEVPIPFVPVTVTLDPLPGEAEPDGVMAYPCGPDSRDRIQAALDQVAARNPGKGGFRGTVFLSKGTYYINGGLALKSGVVLRGEGERGFGTILIVRNPGKAAITMGHDGDAFDGYESLMGVEGLCITGNYDTSIKGDVPGTDAPHPATEAHSLSTGVAISSCVNAWVRGIRAVHTATSAVAIRDSLYVTVRDCISLSPFSVVPDEPRNDYSNTDSAMILVYNCLAEEDRYDSVTGLRDSGPISLFEQQLNERIGKEMAYRVLTTTLSKASLPMKIVFPTAIVNGLPQGEPTPERIAFEEADSRTWGTVMSDDCTGDWKEKWFLDGEGYTTVFNSAEGMELRALKDHMVLWTKQSFEGDLKIEYEFTRTDDEGSGVCIIYIQATGSGEEGFDKDIAMWRDSRESPGMGKYFQNMNTYHVSYACGYVRGRRYMPAIKKMNTFTELTPEYVVNSEEFFEPGVPHRITILKNDRDIRMKAVGAGKALYFILDNRKCPPITEGRIGLRQMRSRWSRYKDFSVSVSK